MQSNKMKDGRTHDCCAELTVGWLPGCDILWTDVHALRELLFVSRKLRDKGRSDRSFVICTAYHVLLYFMARQPSWPGPHFWGFDITLRHTTLGSTPLDEGSVRHRYLYLTAHNTHNRHVCTGGIRPRNPGKRAAADPRLRLCGHWDWLA
jgi:hypothetical protein